jgi:hypothetical protein
MRLLIHKKISYIEQQKRTIKRMIAYYCKTKHQQGALCEECKTLTEYALARLTLCKYGDKKPSCRKCPTHCYAPIKKQMMEERMRVVGPKMVYLRYFLAAYENY